MRGIAQRMAATAIVALMATTANAQTPKDTVVMAKQIDDIISLDPAEAFEFSGVEVGADVYDKLMGVDPANKNALIGELAQSWTVTPDNLTYTFRLRPGCAASPCKGVEEMQAATLSARAPVTEYAKELLIASEGFRRS